MAYKLLDENTVVRLEDGACIPFDPKNRDYRKYMIWLSEGNFPIPADPAVVHVPPTFIEYDKPVNAPDFIVSTPKIKDDPENALDDAIAEMKKGDGSEKSIALIVLSLTKYLEVKRAKLR